MWALWSFSLVLFHFSLRLLLFIFSVSLCGTLADIHRQILFGTWTTQSSERNVRFALISRNDWSCLDSFCCMMLAVYLLFAVFPFWHLSAVSLFYISFLFYGTQTEIQIKFSSYVQHTVMLMTSGVSFLVRCARPAVPACTESLRPRSSVPPYRLSDLYRWSAGAPDFPTDSL